VFLTVLYPRLGSGLLSPHISSGVWRVLDLLARISPARRATLLSFCGPVILVVFVLIWAALLVTGTALVIQPELGTGIVAKHGATEGDFVTALEASGDSLAFVSASNYSPHTTAMRLFVLFTSLAGLSVVSLTITYLLEVFNALHARNVLALAVHTASGEKGDAAELIAGVGPHGRFEMGITRLENLETQMLESKEAHHFYPVLFYFHLTDPFYDVVRLSLVVLDGVSLLRTTTDETEFGWLHESGALDGLERAAMLVITNLSGTFVPERLALEPQTPDATVRGVWIRRYQLALDRLRKAKIKTIEDARVGVEKYIEQRAQWERHLRALAPLMAHAWHKLDCVGGQLQAAHEGNSTGSLAN
jgi:hypothetical protein